MTTQDIIHETEIELEQEAHVTTPKQDTSEKINQHLPEAFVHEVAIELDEDEE